MNLVWVEYDAWNAVRIFKSASQAARAMDHLKEGRTLDRVSRRVAVESIRRQVLNRQKGKCISCEGDISWETMHLDEVKDRGKGGLIALDNCEGRCSDCHIGPRGKHGLSRSPRFGEKKK